MIEVTFADDALKELYETGKTTDRRYKAICKKQKVVDGFVNAVNLMKSLNKAEDLAVYSYLHYEKLKHNFSVHLQTSVEEEPRMMILDTHIIIRT